MAKNAYGPPYIENQEMFLEFTEECTSKSIGLQTIHDCLAAKVDPKIPFRSHNNNRAMHYAARHGNIMMARMILRAKGVMECRNSLGQTPLMVAASGRFGHHTAFLRFAIAHGGDVNAKDRGGNTALVLAVISGAKNNIGLLLHHKATVIERKKEILTYDDPEALGIAKYLRALDIRMDDVEHADEYFDVEKMLGPSLMDRIFGLGLCSDSHHIVDMLERAAEGKYLNYYEIHMENVSTGAWQFFERYILGRKPKPPPPKVIKKILPVQVADPTNIDRMQEERKAARQRKKELEEFQIMQKNVEAARREISAVSSADTMKLLYGKKQAGHWVEKDGWSRTDAKDRNKIRGGMGNRADAESRWEFKEIEADRSLGVHLDAQKYVGWEAMHASDMNVDEAKEKAAIDKLAAKLKELDGKKIWEIDYHKKDFSIGGVPMSRDGARYKRGQLVHT